MEKVWLIPAAIVALILVAFATVDAYRVPTAEIAFVEERPDDVEAATLTIEGVKCRGTSILCAQQIEEIPGVVSMTAYTRTRTVIIEYDPTRTDLDTIKSAICRPVEYDGRHYQVFSISE
ncbi:MAG: hypothetical protein GF400_10255 [Candidatus Eisenbacteria bacterium]|nr:hypothetical protein [Candidatus Eisenbacteria bacterium]